MLVKILSDIHLEAAPFKYVDHGEQVLVLAGDIGEGMRGVNWAVNNIPCHIRVLYVPGNHEYYGHDYTQLNEVYRLFNENNSHVRIMLNETYTEESWDVEFVCSTLWTNFDLYGNAPLHGESWRRGLNDSVYITDGGRKIVPQDFIDWNAEAMAFINAEAGRVSKKRKVLVTHYCFEMSVSEIYKGDSLTPGFAVRINPYTHSAFDFHVHGHTHDSFEYEMPYGTKVICNPRGYSAENLIGFDEELVIDV